MPTEIKDLFTSVTYDEQGGKIKRANRTFLITGLTTPMDPADPGYDEKVRDWTRIGDHSFTGPDGQVRTYL